MRTALTAPLLAILLALGGFGAAAQEPPPAPSGTSPWARLLLMPDLSAVAGFDAAWNSYDVGASSPRSGPYAPEGKLAFQFQELELGLKAVVDPYARAEIYVAFSPEEVSVEEAFVATTSLPAGLLLRAGRLFAPFGRLNVQHPHAWDFVDAPLVHTRLVADEVLAGPGVELSWMAPLPWFAELRAAAQSIAPSEEDEERFTGIARLVQHFPLGGDTTLGIGLSAAAREEGAGVWRELGSADLHVRWRPPAGRESVTLQGELVGRRLTEGGGEDWGAFAQLFWRTGARAGIGVRWEQAPVEAASGFEQRLGAVGTWYLSEFQRIRLQLSRDVRPSGATGFEAIAHLEFGIGAHGAHPF